MLAEFVSANREDLIARTCEKVSKRSAPRPTERELSTGVPLFLDQLIVTLKSPTATMDRKMDNGAAAHGAALMSHGYTVSQVIHDYGDICQAVTELAEELDAPITAKEFHTFNGCLDNAIAEAVTEYSRLRERSVSEGEAARAGVVAEHLRHRISAIQLAFMAIQSGHAPLGGSVAAIITRSLQGMTSLITRALVEVRLDTGNALRKRIQLHQLIEEAEVEGLMEANVRGVSLNVPDVDRGIDVDADPQILAGSVANILQNAFKFTLTGGTVSLRTSSSNGSVAIEIEDQCGGLPPGKCEELSKALLEHGESRSGLGLGLFISRKGIEANGGGIRVRDVPGSGCVFTIHLPRLASASTKSKAPPLS